MKWQTRFHKNKSYLGANNFHKHFSCHLSRVKVVHVLSSERYDQALALLLCCAVLAYQPIVEQLKIWNIPTVRHSLAVLKCLVNMSQHITRNWVHLRRVKITCRLLWVLQERFKHKMEEIRKRRIIGVSTQVRLTCA